MPTAAREDTAPAEERDAVPAEEQDAVDLRHCTIRERIRTLVEPMPMSAVRELYTLMEPDTEINQEDRIAVREVFIEHLNQFRPQRARRVFSELFVDIWVDDPMLLRARRPVPGLVLRLDVAALWRQLSRTTLVEIARTAQEVIDRLAETMLINDAMRTPKAMAVQERMRLATVQALEDLLAGDLKSCRAFLDGLNSHRQSEARTLAGIADPILPLDRGFLQFVRDYLASLTLCQRALRAPGLHETNDDPSEEEAEREVDALIKADDAARAQLRDAEPGSALLHLVPLVQLHVRRRYAAVALYLLEAGDPGPMAEAMLCHFESSCRSLAATLEGALKIDQRTVSAPVRISRRDRATVEAVMTRLQKEIPALILGGILESRVTEPQFLAIWNDTTAFFTGRLVKVISQRITQALTARQQGLLDQADLVWLFRLIWAWQELGRSFELGDQAVFLKWRTHMIEDIHSAVNKAIKFEAGETLPQRIDHLLRLNALADAIGEKISPFLPISSSNIVRMIAEAIRASHGKPTGAKRALIEDFLDSVRDELRKSKRWQSPELANLIDLAQNHGL